ncbi:MAG: hypothetical protein IJL78_06935 [Lachnospiraceae bacterium]|nr:hypothetical protein [Lachnospiraceae bacterium]
MKRTRLGLLALVLSGVLFFGASFTAYAGELAEAGTESAETAETDSEGTEEAEEAEKAETGEAEEAGTEDEIPGPEAARKDAEQDIPADELTAGPEAEEPMPETEAEEPETEPETEKPAEETVPAPAEETEIGRDTAVYINPLYRDVITEADIGSGSKDSGAKASREAEVFSSVEQAAAYVRPLLTTREDEIAVQLCLPGQTADWDTAYALYPEIFDAALAHTGKPEEGDSLKWVYGGYRVSMSCGTVSDGAYYRFNYYNIKYYTTASQESVLRAKRTEVLDQLEVMRLSSDYEKVRKIYDYICSNIVYDYDNLNDESYMLKYTAYAALVDGTSVCQGYSMLLYQLLLQSGVDCRMMTGMTPGGGHAWSIVRIGSVYYLADSTWDAGLSGYRWFLKGSSDFSDHTADEEYTTDEFRQAYPISTENYVPVDTTLPLTFRHNCEFASSIALHYIVPQSELTGYENFRLVIRMEKYEEGAVTPEIETYTLTKWSEYEQDGVPYCRFVFSGIVASEMSSRIYAAFSADKDGVEYRSAVDVYSVRDYAYNRLTKTTSDTYRTFLVDMLNYGAAAQTHFNKNTGNLANADLTPEQQAYGTQGEPDLENNETEVPLEGAIAEIDGKNLVFGSSVFLRYRMTFADGQDMSKVEIVFKYTDSKGVTRKQTVKASKFMTSGSYYTADCTIVIPSDMRCVVSAVICDGSTPISSTLNYSIETYVYSRLKASTSETYKNLIRAMMKYGISAENHFS